MSVGLSDSKVRGFRSVPPQRPRGRLASDVYDPISTEKGTKVMLRTGAPARGLGCPPKVQPGEIYTVRGNETVGPVVYVNLEGVHGLVTASCLRAATDREIEAAPAGQPGEFSIA